VTDDQRCELEWLKLYTYPLGTWADAQGAIAAALTEIDRLRAENAAHKADLDHAALLLHDVAEGHYDAEARGAAREREECVRLLCNRCAAGEMSYLDCDRSHWMHPRGYGCAASFLRNRGPLAPPLPAERLAARVAALEAALAALVRAGATVRYYRDDDGHAFAEAREAARKVLEDTP
jgi:hypothetical protein